MHCPTKMTFFRVLAQCGPTLSLTLAKIKARTRNLMRHFVTFSWQFNKFALLKKFSRADFFNGSKFAGFKVPVEISAGPYFLFDWPLNGHHLWLDYWWLRYQFRFIETTTCITWGWFQKTLLLGRCFFYLR